MIKEAWKPTMNVRWVIEQIIALLKNPDFSDPLEPKIAEECKTDHKKFLKSATDYTAKYAKKK